MLLQLGLDCGEKIRIASMKRPSQDELENEQGPDPTVLIYEAFEKDLGEEFFLRKFEREELICREARLCEVLRDIVSVQRFEEWVWLAAQHCPQAIQVIKADESKPNDFFAERDPIRLMPELLDAGFSIVLNTAATFSPILARFIAEFGSPFGRPPSVGIFLTPPGERGYGLHFDTYDVFVFQVMGTKRWTLHEPVVNSPTNTSRSILSTNDSRARSTVELGTGDLLYVPRGMPHAVQATESGYSLHVSVGFRGTTVAEALSRLLEVAERERPLLRRTFWPTGSPADLTASLADYLDVSASLEAAAAHLSALAWSKSRQSPGRLAVSLASPVEPGLTFRRRAGMPSIVLPTGGAGLGTILMGFPGASTPDESLVSFPEEARPVLEFVTAATGPFSLADVAGGLSMSAKAKLLVRMECLGLIERLS